MRGLGDHLPPVQIPGGMMIIRSVSFTFERRRLGDDDARGILTLDDRQDTRTPRVFRESREMLGRRYDDPPARDLNLR